MDKSLVTDARNVAGPSTFTVAPPLWINRPEKPWPIASRHALRLPSGGSVQDFLGGAACLLIWGVLWLLTILTFAGRFEGPYAVAHPQQVNSSASLVGPSTSCLPGMIELDGRSIADAPCRGGGTDRQR